MKKNFLVFTVLFAVFALLLSGCASGAKVVLSDSDDYLDATGIRLGKPYHEVDTANNEVRYIFIDESHPWGKEGVTADDFRNAKYLVLKLADVPSATMTISWSGIVDGNDLRWNPATIPPYTYPPGIEWDSERNVLWLELSRTLANYGFYASSTDYTQLFFPGWGTGDGGKYGANYIVAGWLVIEE